MKSVIHGIEVDTVELAQKRKLFIATPMFGGNCKGAYSTSLALLFAMMTECAIPYQYQRIDGDPYMSRARDRLATEFMNTDCTELLFIDGDLKFKAGDVLVMMAANKPVIGATYPLKQLNWEKLARLVNSDYGDAWTAEELQKVASSDFVLDYLEGEPINPDRLSKVARIGNGFLMIQKPVIEEFAQTWPELAYRPKRGESEWNGQAWDFFSCGPSLTTGYWEPEDYTFCDRWRSLGGDVWLAPWIELTHVGSYEYTGSMKYAKLEAGKYNVMGAE